MLQKHSFFGCWKNTAGADKTPWMLRKPPVLKKHLLDAGKVPDAGKTPFQCWKNPQPFSIAACPVKTTNLAICNTKICHWQAQQRLRASPNGALKFHPQQVQSRPPGNLQYQNLSLAGPAKTMSLAECSSKYPRKALSRPHSNLHMKFQDRM